ncbi:MAG: hypothetical protein PSU94_16755 [Lacunisphaera sp.]|nr:hypothetical protein [Lacunisphaera sp.]
MIRTRICLYVLLLAPLLVYCQMIFHDFGFRDDYAHLRESREEPGKLVKFTASHGRPLYGALLETSFSEAADVDNLPWLRLTSVALLTLLGLALWRQLYQSGWSEIQAAAIGLGVILLPAAQVVAGWAVCWPHVLALLLAVAGFSAIETELERGGMKRVVALLGGCMIYAVAGLLYQSNVLFAVVPIAAVLLVRGARERLTDLRWAAMHLGALILGLAASYFVVQALFSSGVFAPSPRLQFESEYFGKLLWFFEQPLANALGLYALRDSYDATNPAFWGAVVVVVFVIGFGVKAATDPVQKKKWLLCLIALPFLAHGVSLAAAERAIGYRTLFALSGLVLVLVMFTLRSLLNAGRLKPWMHHLALAVILAGAAFTANRNSFMLLAEPQGYEWDLVLAPVMRTTFKPGTKVYLITPTPADRSTSQSFADEFGSLSSDSDWAPKEMFNCAMRARFGHKLPKGISYTVALGRAVPAASDYDLVIDLRKLSKWRVQ